MLRECIHQQRIPVLHITAEMLQEHQRRETAGGKTESAVGILDSVRRIDETVLRGHLGLFYRGRIRLHWHQFSGRDCTIIKLASEQKDSRKIYFLETNNRRAWPDSTAQS